ncbi:uncharacterized protein LOC125653466 [Ostrea edulis]|uniref:uncharacterized protein LOC125653466 n=1 Tax=Ostrea edulis TaxID=37623 RepID=UPI0024AFD391|nr:uncharacterized protein LOC125653466 [Ostrea edulis]
MESSLQFVWSMLLILLGLDLPGCVESRLFVSYNRARTVTYTSYNKSQYDQANSRLMWIFVGFFFGSIILVLLCFFCYIKFRRKPSNAEPSQNGVAVVSTDIRYDINAPPQYSESVAAGHLKVTDETLPPRYSDIINPPSTGGNSGATSSTADTAACSSALPPDSLRLRTTQSHGSESTESARAQQHEETRHKDEPDTPTHDKAGLVDNEVFD